MAHIFKLNEGSKGIIVFTHKEKNWFQENSHSINILSSLKNRYFIGVHYGHRQETTGASFEDFCMGADSTVSFSSNPPFRIPMNSRSFTPYFFRPLGLRKFYDIINISRNIHLKKLDVFMDAVRKIYDQGKEYKFLLIVPTSENESNNGHFFLDIVEKYNKMFTRKERENFTLIRLSGEHGFLGISPLTISFLYNSSKIFTLLSPGEGESRVIHEALLCGLPVICYKNLYGGGRDYLDSSNSLQFSDYNQVADTFIQAIENYDNFKVNTDYLFGELNEESTIEKLKVYFSNLYSRSSLSFDGNLINLDYLNLRLPAHFKGVDWDTKDPNIPTADISSFEQLEIFISKL